MKNYQKSKTKGRLTLPGEENFYNETIEMLERLGADAIRDSDGTKLPEDIKDIESRYLYYFTQLEETTLLLKLCLLSGLGTIYFLILLQLHQII